MRLLSGPSVMEALPRSAKLALAWTGSPRYILNIRQTSSFFTLGDPPYTMAAGQPSEGGNCSGLLWEGSQHRCSCFREEGC